VLLFTKTLKPEVMRSSQKMLIEIDLSLNNGATVLIKKQQVLDKKIPLPTFIKSFNRWQK
jgi:hypothetical protein